MTEQACFLPWFIRDSDLVTVTPVLGAFLVAGDEPPLGALPEDRDPPEGMLPLTFWVDGHAVASRWFPAEAYKAIRTSPLFAGPVWIAMAATLPMRTPGWMRVDVGAVGATNDQLNGLLDLYEAGPGGAPLVHAGWGRIALPLGHHWVPLPDEVTELLGAAAGDADAARGVRPLVAAVADPVFRRILVGDDGEVAARLLSSIPGIRGERPDADR